MTFDYLIIGQGLAGTLLAYFLQKENKSVHVIDNGHKNSASKIAAGIINPITGRRYVKSWKIDELIPASLNTYKSIEKDLSLTLLHQQNILRVIFDKKAQRYWDDLILKDNASNYLCNEKDLAHYKDILKPIHDFGELTGYRVNLELLISAYANVLSEKQKLTIENFNYELVEIGKSHIEYQGLKARHLIFCDGARAIHNPFFNYLPFQPAKGEAFRIKLKDFNGSKILRHKQFIVPMDHSMFWSGGGYEWDQLDEIPTSEFKDKWSNDLKDMINLSPEIFDHRAAVRPAVKGRRPLLGTHPKYNNLHIFNGLGTKGASLAPYFVFQLIDQLLNQRPIDEEVNIERFKSLYIA